MNTISKCFCLGSASLLLVACASTSVPPVSKQDPSYKHDSQYMAVVDDAGKKAGVEVVWINPPRAKDVVPPDE